MKKSRTAAKRGTKRARVKELSAERSTAKGGANYTLFLPEGTPVKATQPTTMQTKEPTSMEYPN